MTTESLYRFRCDAPHCTETAIGEKITGTPPEWRILRSTEHIEYVETSPYPARRRKANVLSHAERCIGDFSLHLCAAHHDAFGEHLPRTDGWPGQRGRDSIVTVSCSCGTRLGWTTAVHILAGGGGGPSRSGERLWWRHLPADLRWYAEREPEPSGSHDR